MLEDFSAADFLRNGLLYFVVLFILCGPTLADSNFGIKRMASFSLSITN